MLGCPWQRCTVHFLREMLGHVHRGQQGMIAAALRQVFQADSLADARRVCAEVIGRLEPLAPKVAGLLAEAEDDLIAFYALPARALAPNCAARTLWSASTARSAGARTWWGSSPTRRRCCAGGLPADRAER